jgi:tRNA U34 5-methylaminomethyl-2-thiouridine-forming methyltransferase MnmC
MEGVRLVITGDGSHTLWNERLDETYHSRHGALQESRYVFIRQGLARCEKPNIKVLEAGFGTGLNAWLTWQFARTHHKKIDYHTYETFPLPESIWRMLNYATEEEEPQFELLHTAPWNSPSVLSPEFTLVKHHQSLLSASLPAQTFDVIYYDAFAPNRQPEMWTFEVLNHVALTLGSGGQLVTYCAKGQVKRHLRQAGLRVDALPGPPGKREMIRAVKDKG